MAKYEFDDGDSGGNDTETLKMEPPAMVRAKVDGVFSVSSKYGQSLGVNLSDVRLVDGIFGRGGEESSFEIGEDNNGTLKILSWDSEMSVPNLDEDTTTDELPDVVQRNYVGNTYKYEVLESRLEADEDVGYGNDPEEEIELGEFVYFTGSTKNGPKSASKTLSQILSTQGRDVILDADSQDEWLDEDVALREDLMGREVILALTKRTSDETGRTFHHPYVLDGKTRAPIFVDNSNSDDSSEDESDEEDDEETEDGEDDEYPEGIEELYETCADLNINGEDAIRGLLDDLIAEGDISEEAVEERGRDRIIEDLT